MVVQAEITVCNAASRDANSSHLKRQKCFAFAAQGPEEHSQLQQRQFVASTSDADSIPQPHRPKPTIAQSDYPEDQHREVRESRSVSAGSSCRFSFDACCMLVLNRNMKNLKSPCEPPEPFRRLRCLDGSMPRRSRQARN
jgi:hypothetical protein